MSLIQDPSSGTAASVKPPSTAPQVSDQALVVSISPNTPGFPVTGTVSVSNFPSTQAVTQSGIWSTGRTWDLSSSTDSVTIVPSGTQTVSGTVAATQSGIWTVQPGNTPNSTAWLVTGTGGTFPVTGTFWQTTQPISAASLPLPTGAATSSNQTTLGTQTTEINDGTRTAAIAAASTAATAAQTSLIVAISPNSPVPTGSNNIGSITNITGTVSLPTGAATSSNQTTIGSQTTEINDGTHTAAIKAASTAAVASDTSLVIAVSPNSPLPTGANVIGAVTQSGGPWTENFTQINGSAVSTAATGVQKVGITGNAGAAMDAAGQNAASPANELLIAGQFNTTPTTVTTGNVSPVQIDSAANLLVNLKTALPAGANNIGSITNITGTVSLPTGAATSANQTTLGSQTTELNDGTRTAAIAAASTAAIATQTSLIVALSPNSPVPTGANVIGAVTQSGGPWTENLTQISGSAISTAATGVQKVGITGNTGAAMDAAGQNAASPANELLIAGQFNTTPTTITTGNISPLQLDSAANLLVNLKTALPAGANNIGSITNITGTVSLPTGAATSANQTTLGSQTTEINDGTHTATIKAASTASVATDTSLVIAVSPNSPLPTGSNNIGSITNITGTVSLPTGAATSANQTTVGTQTTQLNDGTRTAAIAAASTAATAAQTSLIVALSPNSPLPAGASTIGVVNQGTAATLANAWSQKITDGTNGPAAVKAASTAAVATDPSLVVALSPNSTLYDSFTNPMLVKNRVSMPATQGVSPVSGLETGLINRTLRVGPTGTLRNTTEILAWHDAIEGTTVNAFWTQSTTTMTIAQTTGVLTLNNSGITTASTDAIITSQRQFERIPKSVLHWHTRANITSNSAANQTVVEMGFGAPAGTTATITTGSFFRWTAAGVLNGVLSFNGTEASTQLLAQGTISTTSYYRYDVFVEDEFVRFIVTDSNDVPIVDTQVQVGLAIVNQWSVSHLPSFARVYSNATGGGTAIKLNISAHAVYALDIVNAKPWQQQMSAIMHHGSINPVTYAQTASSMTAAPATETPSNTAAGYATLGGDYATALTVASENPLSVFAFQIPSPYSFYLTELQFSTPFVTTTIGVTGVPVLEWLIIANCASSNISTGGGQRMPVGLNILYASATQPAGGFCTAQGNLTFNPDVPILCLPGTFLHIAYKVFITSAAATPGVTRGSVFVDGYFE